MRNITLATASFLLVIPVAIYPFLPSNHGATTDDTCRALADLKIEDTNLLSATVVPASGDLPEYCRVLGYVRPAINFEIRLPTSSWNGKFYMAGCGAYCGELESDSERFNAMNIGLKRNYAAATMDGGHWGKNTNDARWAHNNRLAEIDFGYRAVHETARVAKSVIDAFYEQPLEQSYFQGCSSGGRQAAMEAWKFPDDFDGIISGAPDIETTGVTGITYAWLMKSNTGPDGEPILSSSEMDFIEEVVYTACDSLDGLKDGIIEDPQSCTVDPARLQCHSEIDTECLRHDQIEVLRRWYDGPRNSAGDLIYPGGLPPGSEPFWKFWLSSSPGERNIIWEYGEEFLRYLAFKEDPGESYSILSFDFDRDPARLKTMSQIYNVGNADLRNFRELGGKLLMWQGWADLVVPPRKTIEYYEAVEKEVGSREHAQDFFRLFMIPGMDHCGFSEGPGIMDNGFDPLTALEQWVEQGEAPASLLTTKFDSAGEALWTRPVCPYPQRAKYNGQGDTHNASNFECVDPG